MKHWRHIWNRLRMRHPQTRLAVVGLLLALALLAGCASRRVRQTSWPGLNIVDGVVYAANVEQVQAFEAELGQLLWAYPAEPDPKAGFYATPVLDEERNLLLTAGFNSRIVYALRLGDTPQAQPGLVWTFDGAKGQYVGSGVIYEDLFLIGNGDGTLYAINLDNGVLAWSFDAPEDRIWAKPVVVGDRVYVASLDHSLYAISGEDGAPLWERTLNGAIASTPLVLNDSLWVGDFGNKFYQIDLETGDILWTFEGDNWFWASPVTDGEMIFVADVGGVVYALDPVEKTVLWTYEIEDVVRGQPALNADNSLLFVPGYEHGILHALDTQEGQKMTWGTVPGNPGRLPSDLAVGEDHLYTMPILVVERVQAFDLDSGKLAWQYPAATEEE